MFTTVIKSNSTESQTRILRRIISSNKRTVFGREHGFYDITSIDDFSEAVPVSTYDDFTGYIERCLAKEPKVLTSEPLLGFSRTSGTTSASKLIPLTGSFIQRNHFKVSKRIVWAMYYNFGLRKIPPKSLSLNGYYYQAINDFPVADISALLVEKMPKILLPLNFPLGKFTSWEEKLNHILKHPGKAAESTLIAGVPTWVLSLFTQVTERLGADPRVFFKDLKVYLHGGVNFTPYKDVFKEIFDDRDLIFLESYNATEGFFAYQDSPLSEDLLLNIDADIFYEFRAVETKEVVPLEEVEIGKDYSLIITTSSGLYRYAMGDVLRFTSLRPFKFKIVGRDKEYINVFGEDLLLNHVYSALQDVKQEIDFEIEDFIIVPKFIDTQSKGRHEWLIEFRKAPKDLARLEKALDKKVMLLNNNYAQKRANDIAIESLKIIPVKRKTFKYIIGKDRVAGGQSKIKKLHNDRKILESLSPDFYLS